MYHLTLLAGLFDRDFDLNSRVEACAEGRLRRDDFWNMFYAYWLNHENMRFEAGVAGMGCAALRIPDEYWMNTVVRVYDRVRESIRM